MTGKHLIIDASGIRSQFKLSDLEFTYNFLAAIPRLVKLYALGNPHVVKATDRTADGVTGFQLLTTSHASIHTWCNGRREGQVHLDVFSCDDFSEEALVQEFRILYEPIELDVRMLRRI